MGYPVIYAAGPITGLSYGESLDWRSEAYRWLATNAPNARLLSPMRGKEALADVRVLPSVPTYALRGPLSAHTMFARDVHDVRRADVVLANLAGATRISLGTVMEIGIAYEAGVPIVVAMGADDIHQHLFMHEAATCIVETWQDAARWIITSLLPAE